MATVTQQPVPKPFVNVFEEAGIKLKKYRSPTSFERDLARFLKRNHVVHLSTCKDNVARSTPLEYRVIGLNLYVFSEGGAKFDYIKSNPKVSFSIAEPYNSEEDYWGYKGLQGWGRVNVYNRKNHPEEFQEIFEKMNLMKVLRKLGKKELPPGNYRIIEIVPDRIKYGNPREGIFRVTWKRETEPSS